MSKDISLIEIADRVTDAVLECRIINKDELNKIIYPILKIWIKKAVHVPSNIEAMHRMHKQDIRNNKKSQKAFENKQKEMLLKKEVKNKFYRKELIKAIGHDKVNALDLQFKINYK